MSYIKQKIAETRKEAAPGERLSAAYFQAIPAILELWNAYREWRDSALSRSLKPFKEEFQLKLYYKDQQAIPPEGDGWMAKDSKIGSDPAGTPTMVVLWHRIVE